MKKTRTAEELDSLLARGGLGAARRDAILDTVLARVEGERRARSRWRPAFAGLAVAAAAAVALILLVPRFSSRPDGGFRAKGAAPTPTATMPATAIECLGASLAACPTGSLLVVRASGVRGYVSAWAEPVGGGQRIWYFSAETSSPEIDAVTSVGTPIGRAVRIGTEHAAGSYRVEVRVTPRSMTREELGHLPERMLLASGQFVLTVTSP